jgi:hypothetical protein
MPLVVSAPYPTTWELGDGHAVMTVGSPQTQTFGLVDEQLVVAAEDHAGECSDSPARVASPLQSGLAPSF